MRKTYKYKAKISKETRSNAMSWLSLCQKIYNACIEQRRWLYSHRKQSLSSYDQSNQLKELKAEFPEFKKVGSQVLQDVTDRVGKAYKLFYSNLKASNGLAGLPRFKSYERYKSFTLKQTGWSLKGRYLTIKNIGVFKLYMSRDIQGDIKTVTVKQCVDGWYVVFSCDNVPLPGYTPFEKDAVGLDVGISSFVTDSEGNKVDNPKYFRNAEKTLRIKQRKLSRIKKGSNRRKSARTLVAKQHQKTQRQRNDFIFKTANHYIKEYGLIVIEKLKIKNMVKNHCLAKSISDSGWGIFKEVLRFKAEEAGRVVVEVNPQYTSQDCSNCGDRVKKELSERIHSCTQCGLVLDRDHNAAINILNRAGQTLKALT